MEIRATFPISVLFLTVLIFGRAFATFARRNSGPADTQTAPDQDEAAVHTAEQDARRDINKFFSVGIGVGIFCLASFMGISGCLVGNSIFPNEASLGFMPLLGFGDWAMGIGCFNSVYWDSSWRRESTTGSAPRATHRIC